jgi:hypothetical protein
MFTILGRRADKRIFKYTPKTTMIFSPGTAYAMVGLPRPYSYMPDRLLIEVCHFDTSFALKLI